MRTLTAIFRMFVGAWMLWNGLNFFFHFWPQPMGLKSHYLHVAFMQSGMFAFAKATEIAMGIALLCNRLVPALLVIGFPVSVIVAYMGLVIEDPRPAGAILIASHIFLLFAYAPHTFAIFVWKARPMRNVGEFGDDIRLLFRARNSDEPLVNVDRCSGGGMEHNMSTAKNDKAELITISTVTIALGLYFGNRYAPFVGLVHVIGLPWALWELGLIGRRARSRYAGNS